MFITSKEEHEIIKWHIVSSYQIRYNTSARLNPPSATTSPSVTCSVRNRRHTPPCLTPPPTRHASGTRIGLMDSAVPVEAMIGVWEV